jgi:hypothetical protein
MTRISRFVCVFAATAAGALTIGLATANANGTPSDQMVITDQQGRQTVVPVIETGGVEGAAIFNAANNANPQLVNLTSLQTVFGLGPARILVMLDPLGTVPGPGEASVQFGTTGQYVSDILVALVDTANPVFGTTVALYSDGHPIFSDAFSVNLLAQGTLDSIVEDGTLQDVTARLSLESTTFTWQVQSDVGEVPVPPAAWLFGSALGLLRWARRRPA